MFFLFIIWRSIDVIISLVAPFIIPYLGFFPYKDLLVQYHFPDFLSHLASFDGVHYTQIADNGYAQNEQAFFPLYPLLIKALTFFTYNRLASGLIISNVCFFIGLILFKKYLSALVGGTNSRQNLPTLNIIVFLLIFPTSFFFGAVYTEGLFFLLFISSLYFLKRKNYLLAGICAGLSSATRLMGVFLIVPFFFHFFDLKLFKNWKLKIKNLVIFTPLIGFFLYCIYLWITLGDPFFFFNAQPAFGANRSTHFILLPQVYFRYLKIFFTANWNFQYFASLIEFIIFTFVFIILILDLIKNWRLKIKNFERISLSLFSFANLLLPTLTGTFSSIPRYALFSISLFIFLGEIKNMKIKVFLGILFALLHVVLLGFFIQGYFIG